MGSSPRVRGEEVALKGDFGAVGIIPAGAGRRAGACLVNEDRGDHPRGCGEKPMDGETENGHEGSSPRVRGEDDAVVDGADVDGIIPAGAGRSSEELTISKPKWDHPRGCGEKQTEKVTGRRTPGSSPRVRGEAKACHRTTTLSGIIPAGAGRSWLAGLRPGRRGDHPRGCGEKLSSSDNRASSGGSSPRVRGEVGDFFGVLGEVGIIPAGAGRSFGDLPAAGV